jgi:hypothetical protein
VYFMRQSVISVPSDVVITYAQTSVRRRTC